MKCRRNTHSAFKPDSLLHHYSLLGFSYLITEEREHPQAERIKKTVLFSSCCIHYSFATHRSMFGSGYLMELSDEEDEISPLYITNYYFVDDMGGPVSFSILPVQWDENDVSDSQVQVFLRGTCNGGQFYRQVIAWKFELSYALPEVSVLTKDKNWIILQEPKRSFKNIIRKILISLRWIHYVKKNKEASEKSTWKHLLDIFSSYDVKPSKSDLLDYMPLISEAAKRQKNIATSKSFLTLVGKLHTDIAFSKDAHKTKKSKSAVNEADYDGIVDGKESNEKEEIFDRICAICDDGGEILSCQGRCLRSFHTTITEGLLSNCESLGYNSKDEVDAIQNFLCKNCLYQLHQCFACGRLGSSAKSSSQEVFPCDFSYCGHFYHPECVAKLLYAGNKTQAREFRDKITAGEPFTCPVHRCFVCKQFENKNVHQLRFAICRRCPKVYHRKCLPRSIAFKHESNEGKPPRAWGENLLPYGRILIYCMNHDIDRQTLTPVRDHIIFPNNERKRNRHNLEFLSIKKEAVLSNRTMLSEDYGEDRLTDKKRKQVEKLCSGVEISHSTKNAQKKCPRASAEKSKLLLRNETWSNLGQSKQQNMACREMKNAVQKKLIKDVVKTSQPFFNTEIQKGVVHFEAATCSFDKEFTERQKAKHASCSNTLHKSVTLELVEDSVESVRTALQKIESGYGIEHALAVCGPEVLNQIIEWKVEARDRKLDVYLAPFLHGIHYTSYGRHFTKVEKLKEIVDRLHWYVQGGDTIVDFCCGTNDFSCLMKEKLEQDGKSCSFKNYDLIQAKNDFSFEMRDWMSVRLEELPNGSHLTMGLNPPFGVNESHVNAFIDKALKYKPKLIILIAPKDTERLDEKAPYNLIWEDDTLLSGKSFCVPGSVNMNDERIGDWNNNPPSLYLWSHVNWTTKHMAIAREHGHIHGV